MAIQHDVATPNRLSTRARWGALASTLACVVTTSTLTTGGAAALAAPPNLPPCPTGQVRITVAGKSSCVVAALAIPKPPPTQTTGSFLVGMHLGGRLDRLDRKAFPPSKEAAGAPSPLASGAAALSPGIETMARAARAAAARPRVGAPVLTALPTQSRRLAGGWTTPQVTTSSNAAATRTVSSTSLAAGDTTGTMTGTGVVPRDAQGRPDPSRATLEMGMSIGTTSGGVASFALTMAMNDKLRSSGPCPTSAGRIDMSGSTTTSFRTAQEGVIAGIDYIRKNTTVTSSGTYVATVAPDAYLESTAFTTNISITAGHALSGLGGLITQNHVINMTGRASGTVNGRTGAVSIASLQIDGNGRSLGMSDAAASAAVRSALQGNKDLGELTARLAADAHERLKEAEKIWRQPNKCVDMRFTPASGAKLAAGARLGVDGKIVAKKDGKPTTAVWRAPRITRGSLASAWPGTSLPTGPLRFTAKGASPDAAGRTFAMTTTAMSRAGLASGPWNGSTGGWRVTISGPVTGEQGQGFGLATTVKAVVDVRLVTRGGVSAYHAVKPFTYTAPVVTQPVVGACLPPPGSSTPSAPTYQFSKVEGDVDVLIVPERTAIAPNITVTLSMGDRTTGTLTCPESGPLPLESLLIGLHRLQHLKAPTLTVPAAGISTRTVSWSTPAPLKGTGALTVRIEPI